MTFRHYLVFLAFCLVSFPAFAYRDNMEVLGLILQMYFVISVLTTILYFFRSPQGCLIAVVLEVPAVVIISVFIFNQSDPVKIIIFSYFILLALIIYFRPAKVAEIQLELVEGKLKSSYQITRRVYILQTMGFIFSLPTELLLPVLFGFAPIFLVVAVLLNYAKKTNVSGTWLESHFRWQIRTFWFYFLPFVILFAGIHLVEGLVNDVTHILFFLWYLWVIYRTMKGWTKLIKGKEMYQ